MKRSEFTWLESGFTLIELSIVMVIIGLIIGGILFGRDLIVQAESRKLISQIESYKAAVGAFRTKYNCLPGDCPNATSYFDADSACNTTVGASTYGYRAGSDTPNGQTCNGDGNGSLARNNNSGFAMEQQMFWQQLALAKLIAGQYTGTGVATNCNAGGNCDTTFDKRNTPTTPFPDTYLEVLDVNGGYGGWGWLYPTSNQHSYLLTATQTNPYWQQSMTIRQNYAIDVKIDNGVPSTGSVTSAIQVTGGTTCVNTGTTPPSYNLSRSDADTVKYCVPLFAAGF